MKNQGGYIELFIVGTLFFSCCLIVYGLLAGWWGLGGMGNMTAKFFKSTKAEEIRAKGAIEAEKKRIALNEMQVRENQATIRDLLDQNHQLTKAEIERSRADLAAARAIEQQRTDELIAAARNQDNGLLWAIGGAGCLALFALAGGFLWLWRRGGSPAQPPQPVYVLGGAADPETLRYLGAVHHQGGGAPPPQLQHDHHNRIETRAVTVQGRGRP